MPYSHPEHKDAIRNYLEQRGFMTVVDFGAGSGTYGKMIKKIRPFTRVIGVEIWTPYIERFHLKEIYDELIVGDLSTLPNWPGGDCAIFGDVIEHFDKETALKIIERAKATYQHIIISIPIIDWPQKDAQGNPHETHRSQWTFEELCELMRPCGVMLKGEKIGVFIK